MSCDSIVVSAILTLPEMASDRKSFEIEHVWDILNPNASGPGRLLKGNLYGTFFEIRLLAVALYGESPVGDRVVWVIEPHQEPIKTIDAQKVLMHLGITLPGPTNEAAALADLQDLNKVVAAREQDTPQETLA
jgi:hypothetical protein